MLWLGGAALVGVTVAAVVYEKNKAPTSPVPTSLTPGTWTPTTVFNTGGKYGVASQLGANVTGQAALVQALTAAGWTGVQVIYFGPTAAGAAPPPGTPTVPGSPATAYIASGIWNGANNTPVPTGVVAVQVA
jgi:hypothetical protein